MTRKILSILLCVILSAFAVCANAEDEAGFEVTEVMYKYEFLSKLGITEATEFPYLDLEKAVSRADLAKFAVKMSSPNSGEPNFTEGIFSDVSAETLNGAYVTEAYNSGIMNGYGDGTFKPEKEVMVGEFLKTMVILLGADAISAAKGGYYRGYINVANQKGILPSGVSEATAVNLKIASAIMYDTLLAPISDISSLGKSISYTDSESLLYTNFGIYKTEGVLSAVYGYSLYGISECEKDELEIARQRYKIGEEESYVSFFGDKTACFFKTDSADKRTVVYIYPINENRLTVEGRDIKSVNTDTVKYGDKEKSIRMETDAVTVINGVYAAGFRSTPQSVFDSKKAQITFVDNNNNGKYDIALVFEYETYTVSAYGRNKNVIYLNEGQLFQGSNEIVLGTETDNNEVPYYVYSDGEIAELKNLNTDDVISVAKSSNIYGDPTYTIHVSKKKITGTIETLSDDKATFVSDSEPDVKETYYISPNYAYLSNESIKVGVSCEYLLNHKGEIAARGRIKKNDGTAVGYLTAVRVKNNAFDTRVGFQILGSNGKFAIYEGEEKITLKITQSRSNVTEEVYKKERFSALKERITDVLTLKDPMTGIAKEKWHGGLVKYKLTENETLKEIQVSCDLSAEKGYEGYDKNNFSLDLIKNGTGTMRCLRGWLSPKIRLEKTRVFYVPDEIIDDTVNEDDYLVGGIGIIGGRADYYYNDFKIYDLNDTEMASADYMVKEYKAGSSEQAERTMQVYENNVIIVTDMTRAYDEKLGEVYKLSGLRKGMPYTCMVGIDDELPKESNMNQDPFTKGMKFTDIKEGDIIQCSYDAMNNIEYFHVLYRKSTDEGNHFGIGFTKSDNSANNKGANPIPVTDKSYSLLGVYGKVTQYDKTTKVGAVDWRNFPKEDGYSDEYYYVYFHFGIHIATVTLVENGKATKIAADAIQVGDEVFVCGYWNDISDIVVFR